MHEGINDGKVYETKLGLADRVSEADFYVINDPQTMLKRLHEIDYGTAELDDVLPERADVIDLSSYNFLVAKINEAPVGSMFIKKDGPVDAEMKVFAAALIAAYPDQWPISIFYKLFVEPAYRNQYVAWDLVAAAEQCIADSQDAHARSALWVECDNHDGIPVIVKSGYEFVKYNGSYGAVLGRSGEDKPPSSLQPVYLFSKDLSHFRTADVK